MADERPNERLRAAIRQKGIDPEQLSVLVQVDVKTVYRWLAGRTPRPRYRTMVARALERNERELWPDAAIEVPAENPQREIQGAWPHANDYRAPDWRVLMRDAVEQIDLLDYTLLDIVSAAGITDMLEEKGASGCRVRALIAAPDSIWVASAAKQLGLDEQDYISRTELELEIELARGHLEPLIGKPGIEIRHFYAERYNTILRFDDQMLVTLHLWGTPTAQAPMLHLRRRGDGGLFDQFAHHLDEIIKEASESVDPAPDHYPDPHKNPDRYRPTTKETYEQQNREVDWHPPKRTPPPSQPDEQSGDELRSYIDRLSDDRHSR
jgi:lambda repressor-like predicted transcriptional regulator